MRLDLKALLVVISAGAASPALADCTCRGPGVVAYAAAQRRGEMATRLALGAAPGQVFWLVLKHGAVLAAFGTAIGLTAAYFAGRLVSSQIYAVNASDPLILTAATTLVVGIAVAATTIPALRASRLDPSGVLRPE